jgi:hypothetical protein
MNYDDNQIPYTDQGQDHNQIMNTVEAFGLLMCINYLWRKAHNHVISGILLVVCIVVGFLALINSDYGDNNFLVIVFWVCMGTGFISIVKILSR